MVHPCFYQTRSCAALRAADLDWIVGPEYSLSGYIFGDSQLLRRRSLWWFKVEVAAHTKLPHHSFPTLFRFLTFTKNSLVAAIQSSQFLEFSQRLFSFFRQMIWPSNDSTMSNNKIFDDDWWSLFFVRSASTTTKLRDVQNTCKASTKRDWAAPPQHAEPGL